jgi:hypothetical protein
VIDCGSTVTIIREDMATAFDLKITNYSGGKVIGVTGDKLVPIGKAHIKMTIEDSLGQRVHVHADPIVVKDTPIKLLVGNVKMKMKCVIDFADKTLKFNTNALQSKTGIYMVICKQCIAGDGNAVHIKQDCILLAQAKAVTRVATGNKSCVEDVVCMVASNPKAYTKYQLLTPYSVTDTKCGETTVAICNFSNEPKRIKAGTMMEFYEKLDDAKTLIKITNDLDNNRTHWWSIEESVNSGSQTGKGVVRPEVSRCQDNQHFSCVV